MEMCTYRVRNNTNNGFGTIPEEKKKRMKIATN